MMFVSSADQSLTWVGVFSSEEEANQTRALKEDNFTENYRFNLQVTKHDKRDINIKIDFEHPEVISKNIELDNMHIKILQPEVFMN